MLVALFIVVVVVVFSLLITGGPAMECCHGNLFLQPNVENVAQRGQGRVNFQAKATFAPWSWL